jgi:hypothetical protein
MPKRKEINPACARNPLESFWETPGKRGRSHTAAMIPVKQNRAEVACLSLESSGRLLRDSAACALRHSKR